MSKPYELTYFYPNGVIEVPGRVPGSTLGGDGEVFGSAEDCVAYWDSGGIGSTFGEVFLQDGIILPPRGETGDGGLTEGDFLTFESIGCAWTEHRCNCWLATQRDSVSRDFFCNNDEAGSGEACGGLGEGVCVMPGVCRCWPGYEGSACELGCHDQCVAGSCGNFSFDLVHNETKGPSDPDGDLSDVFGCACFDGWVGDFCEIPLCDPFLCGDNALCVGPNLCGCELGWGGPDCMDMLFCNDIPFNESQVCNGRGQCVDFDKCECDPSFSGLDCEILENVPDPNTESVGSDRLSRTVIGVLVGSSLATITSVLILAGVVIAVLIASGVCRKRPPGGYQMSVEISDIDIDAVIAELMTRDLTSFVEKDVSRLSQDFDDFPDARLEEQFESV